MPTSFQARAVFGDGGDLGTGLAARRIRSTYGLALDKAGDLFVADFEGHKIHRIHLPTGSATTIAGTGEAGYAGDGGPALRAQLRSPQGIGFDGSGNLFIADTGNHAIRRIDAESGAIETVAGTGKGGNSGDGGPAVKARLRFPSTVLADEQSNLFIADTFNHAIRKVDAELGTIETVAGGAVGSGSEWVADEELQYPYDIALAESGDLYIADTFHHVILRLDATDNLWWVDGDGGYTERNDYSGKAQLKYPYGIALDAAGDLYIADTDRHIVRWVDIENGVRVAKAVTVAGTGVAGYSGDGGQATQAELQLPRDIVVDAEGNLLIGEPENQTIRRVDRETGTISTVVRLDALSGFGNGGPALSAQLSDPYGLSVNADGQLLIADSSNHIIRLVDLESETIQTIAGNAEGGYQGDGGQALSASLRYARDVAFDGDGSVYVADSSNHVIRKVTEDGIVSTVAGTGVAGYSGDGGPATSAELSEPFSVALDAEGNVFIADRGNHRIRRVDAFDNTISTVAGSASLGFGGDGGAATSAKLYYPYGVAVDEGGNIFIADTFNNVIRKVTESDGIITTVAGTGLPGYSGDTGSAESAQLRSPYGVTVDSAGHLFIADSFNHAVRRVDADSGTITTVAGVGTLGYSGDGEPATAARLHYPYGLALDEEGDLYIADTENRVIRRVSAQSGIITTIAGRTQPEGLGAIEHGAGALPSSLIVGSEITFMGGSTTGTLQAYRPAERWLEVVAGRYPYEAGFGSTNLARFQDETFGDVYGVAYDESAGKIYITETTHHRVLVITTEDIAREETWTIQVLAGTGEPGSTGGAAASATFREPKGLWLDGSTLYVADTGNHMIRSIDLSQGLLSATVTTIAGTGSRGFSGDGGPASFATLRAPVALTSCSTDEGINLYIADTENHRIRRIDAAGIISTIIGDGDGTSLGTGAPAVNFSINSPRGLDCDPHGNLFVTSRDTVKLIGANSAGVADGTGFIENAFESDGQGIVATCLTGLDVLGDGLFQVVDGCSGQLIEIVRDD